MRFRALFAFALALVVFACGERNESRFDRAALEHDEDLTESLANDLLAFSAAAREGDGETVARHVAASIEATPWPAAPDPAVPLVKWIEKRPWTIPAPRAMSGEEFLRSFETFLGRLSEIEDVRFKVKHAEFEPKTGAHGEAGLKYFMVARDPEGRREWIKGTAKATVEREGEGPWRLTAFRIETLESKVSRVDLFSEIALPAGVREVFPPFGVGKNQGFVSHGAATADVDGDGLLDLAATGVDRNVLYLNDGKGGFRDASEESRVALAPTGSGALFLDYDNDGDPDLFLASVGRQILLENRRIPDGKVVFRDVSDRMGVDREAVGFSAIAADVNADGRPDVYVCSYNRYGTVMPNSWIQATNGTPNLLFVSQPDGTYQEEAAERGVADSRWSYAAGFLDLDGDGDPDLYVANDFGEDGLYRNEGGRFADVAADMGALDPGFGMGVSFGDYDNDGDFDLHVTNMSSTAGNRILQHLYPSETNAIRVSLGKQAAGNTLYRNEGGGKFTDVSGEVGGLAGGWAFGGGFVDLDNDGWEDLHTPNGFVSGKSMKDT